MTDKEVMQMALGALESLQAWPETPENFKRVQAIEALRAALEQPEPEPVAMKFQIYKQTPPRGRELEPINSALLPWVYDQDPSSGNTASMWVTPVATLPPRKEWVGLTDDEIGHIENRTYWITKVTNSAYSLELCRSVEAKLKEKNT